ncbi:MAG TPA: NAD-dependent epimerase/dehydratase family protein [Anaerolineae bacterium]|nr:NAD-dependent epimerase/dehydratase family protein [Anaerolineae bacterium]
MISPSDSFWLDRPVLVTGCTGFLGSWLTIALAEAGASVVGLVRDEVPFSHLHRSGYQERITVVRGDVTDYALIERTLNEYEIDAVFHLAAQTIVPIANRAPLSTFETNVKGTWTVLEAARRSPKVTRVAVASSDKAYGAHEGLPYTEGAPLLGCHPYDVSKACADLIARAYAATYDLPVAVTRCANLYGGGDLNWSRIVPGTVRSVIRGEPPIVRSDGTPLRDYLYVHDAVHAYLMLAEHLDDPEVRGEAFNFGTDAPKSVLEMVETIIAVSDHPELKPVVLGEAANEIQDQYLDSTKARQVLGWEPAYSLEEGLKETVAWYREFLQDAGAG